VFIRDGVWCLCQTIGAEVLPKENSEPQQFGEEID